MIMPLHSVRWDVVVIRVGIVGAAGYAGGELMRLLMGHEGAVLTKLVSRTHAGKSVSEVYPGFYRYDLPDFQEASVSELADICDAVFLASPAGAAWPWIKELTSLNPEIKIIDIGSDLRLKDASLYEEWYGYTHGAPELLSEAEYGLTELHSAKIQDARLVANPGCYPTATILALAPLIHFGLVRADSLIVNALSGVSGAGRTPGQGYHFPECNENARAYGLLRHRHIPEIVQELAAISKAGGYDGTVSLSFTPHLVPLNRGILVTGWADLASGVNVDIESLRETYEGFYEGKTFIRILPPDRIPQTKAVLGSNYCDISVRVDGRTKRVLVMSAIDNLVKGAAGQAIQNMNLMFGEPEDRGLKSAPIWP